MYNANKINSTKMEITVANTYVPTAPPCPVSGHPAIQTNIIRSKWRGISQ